MIRALRFLTVAILAIGICVAVVYVVYPDLILRAWTVSVRRSAGLEVRTVEAAGHRIVYLDGGNGPPVVLLHGFGADKDLWNAVAAELTRTHRVIVPDLPGFGESSVGETERYDAESQARRVRAFLEVLGVREHHLGGNSMGGAISAVYAALYPDSVKTLLLAAPPGVRSPERSDLDRALEAGENPLLVRDEHDLDALMELAFFRPPSIPGPLKRAMLVSAARKRTTYARIFEDLARAGEDALEALLPLIGARTLVVWGAHDRIVHPSSLDVFTAAIAGSEGTVLEACGHALPRECADRLVERYLRFLRSVP